MVNSLPTEGVLPDIQL